MATKLIKIILVALIVSNCIAITNLDRQLFNTVATAQNNDADFIKIQDLLRAGANPSVEINDSIHSQLGNAPLFLAITNRNASAVLILLNFGADTSAIFKGFNGLHAAVLQFPDLVDLILRYSVFNTDICTVINYREPKFHKTALDYAIDNGLHAQATKIANAQLKYCSEYSQELSEDLNVELINAARNGNLKRALHLIARGADPNKQIKMDPQLNIIQTALHAAVYERNRAMVRLLLASGADPNIRNDNDFNPLMRAVNRGYFDIVTTIINFLERPTLQKRFIKLAKDPKMRFSTLAQDISGLIAQYTYPINVCMYLKEKDGRNRTVLDIVTKNLDHPDMTMRSPTIKKYLEDKIAQHCSQ